MMQRAIRFLNRRFPPKPADPVRHEPVPPGPPVEPVLTMPEAEAALLRWAYGRAGTILEYGAGGSTVLAAGLPGRAVVTVESDRAWVDNLSRWFDQNPPVRPVTLHHADVGPTGKWGMPTGTAAWRQFHGYPLSVWDRPDLPHPDVVLIDGRFRLGCFLATLFRITRPVTVCWDDYADRTAYHEAERYVRPVEIVGRMARFELEPMAIPTNDLTWILAGFARTN